MMPTCMRTGTDWAVSMGTRACIGAPVTFRVTPVCHCEVTGNGNLEQAFSSFCDEEWDVWYW